MPHIDIKRDHQLGHERARELVEQLAARLQAKLEVRTHWENDVLHFERSGIDGRITVSGTNVRVEVRLGLMMAAFKPMLESEIHRRLDEALG